VAAERAAMNRSGVGVLPPNCDQNIIASGSVYDITTFIVFIVSWVILRTTSASAEYAILMLIMFAP
jgi:hypothetical protein